MGMDSLLAIEFRNRLKAALGQHGKRISATLIFNYPTIDAIGNYLLEEILPEQVLKTEVKVKKKLIAERPSQKPSRPASCARSIPSPAALQNSPICPRSSVARLLPPERHDSIDWPRTRAGSGVGESMSESTSSLRSLLARGLLVTLAYYLGGRAGLALPYYGVAVTLLWPPTGIALAALLRWGPGMSPAILAGAWLVNFHASDSVLISSLASALDVLVDGSYSSALAR